ncbi:GH25 family lysozyme [Nannocystis punicea]|uniref:GH25 family lysozyme n=1 Tax=Nannocystis punicea TaxID=2995304 RepID=A0ABY7H9J4_9BACT|nr:GH25 family lysozyme [Nannocystis poenicansa]WAS95664.1 GH25 family lysozyme [Nannocystis poenicansa]
MDAQEFNELEIYRHRLDLAQVAHLLELGVREVQRACGLAVDGKADPATLSKIPCALNPGEVAPSDSAAFVYNQQMLASGAVSPDRQSFLIEAGAQAVQHASGLLVDGKAGPNTREALDALSRDQPRVQGIDVSFYQGKIDWPRVATANAFAFIRATQGVTKTDSQFSANWAGARAAGVLRGPYHFLEAGANPVQQAEHFAGVLAEAGGLGNGDLPPTLDVEPREREHPTLQNVLTCLEVLEKRLGCVPIVYIQDWYYELVLKGAAELHRYPLWIAGRFNTYTGWAPSFWQYGKKAMSGIRSEVDADRFLGDIQELRRLTVDLGGAHGVG